MSIQLPYCHPKVLVHSGYNHRLGLCMGSQNYALNSYEWLC